MSFFMSQIRPIGLFTALALLVPALPQDGALALNNHAAAAHLRGDCDSARDLYHRALSTATSELAAKIHSNLGALHQRCGRLDEARREYQWVAGRARAQSPAHAIALNNLAGVVRLQGEPRAALRLYRQALVILDAGEPGFDMAVVTNNLAVTLGDLRRFREAADYFERSLALKRRLVGAAHPQVEWTERSYREMMRDVAGNGSADTVDVLELAASQRTRSGSKE